MRRSSAGIPKPKMRICFVSPLVPSVAYGHRPYSFLTELSRLGHEVTLVCLNDPGPVPDAASKLETLGIEVRSHTLSRPKRWANCLFGLFSSTPLRVLHCKSRSFERYLRQLLEQQEFDVLHFDRFRLASYGMKIMTEFQGPVVIDFPDSLSLYYRRAVDNPRHFLKKWIDRRENRVTPDFEKRVLQSGMTTIVCSELDRDCLFDHSPDACIEVIPNMVDIDEFTPRSKESEEVMGVFTGTLYYLPNIDGLLWLKDEVLPLLDGIDFPTQVIGYGATSELESLENDSRIDMVGYVENMADHLYLEDIYLCPLRVGAGIRFKLLEAFSAGMATISTTLGYEGIPCTPGEHLLVADTPADFASAILYLVDHPEEKKRLGENAREFVRERYSVEATGLQLVDLYQSLIRSG